MKSAYVIGLGKSGIAAANLLQQIGVQVTVSDSGTTGLDQRRQQLETAGITVKLGHKFSPAFVESLVTATNGDRSSSLPLIVASPGVPWDLPGLLKAREIGIETIGEMELAWRYLQQSPWVGITGTNGKTTTTALTAAIFQTAGLHAPSCGNIGNAACELALQVFLESKTKSSAFPDWVIAEASSYQIEASPTLAPKIGIWTTFTADHLARHQTLENYFNIKAQLLHRSEYKVFNGDDAHLRDVVPTTWPDAYWTSISGWDSLPGDPSRSFYLENGWVASEGQAIVNANSLRMVGTHNQQNLLLAVAAASIAGIEPEAIAQAIEAFPGVPHRLEHICTWKEINYINDSKATNYDAALVGLNAVDAPVILIAGGEAKAGDDATWLHCIKDHAAFVLLIGSAANQFAERLKEYNYKSYEIVETLDAAVVKAGDLAQKLNASTVLLSPACASFDQYPNFEARGDHFRQLCQSLYGDA